MSLLKDIKADLQFSGNYNPKGIILEMLNINFQALVSYRIQHAISKWPRGLRLLVLPLKLITEYLTSCQIHFDAQIAGGIKIHHCMGVIIGGGVKIGRGCNILQNVTLGTKRLGVYEMPEIGKYTTIYAGAVIVGKITIGNNCDIGANSVVTKDVPDDCIVVGIPGKVTYKSIVIDYNKL